MLVITRKGGPEKEKERVILGKHYTGSRSRGVKSNNIGMVIEEERVEVCKIGYMPLHFKVSCSLHLDNMYDQELK